MNTSQWMLSRNYNVHYIRIDKTCQNKAQNERRYTNNQQKEPCHKHFIYPQFYYFITLSSAPLSLDGYWSLLCRYSYASTEAIW